MVPTATAAASELFGCSATQRRWAALSAAVSGHRVSKRESNPAPSAGPEPLSPFDCRRRADRRSAFGVGPYAVTEAMAWLQDHLASAETRAAPLILPDLHASSASLQQSH